MSSLVLSDTRHVIPIFRGESIGEHTERQSVTRISTGILTILHVPDF